MEPRFVYVTCKDRPEALKIGKSLVEARLAACANVIDGMESIYWWEGNLETGSEAVLILKSTQEKVAALTAAIQAQHSYTLPCVVALPIVDGNLGYLDWVRRETAE